MTEEKQYLTRGQASEYCLRKGLPVSPKTLAKYACVGGGPKFRKFGKTQVVYDIADLDAWVAEQLSAPVHSTSERG